MTRLSNKKLAKLNFHLIFFRMESFMAEFLELKSYRKTLRGVRFEKKRKLFDQFVHFKKGAKKQKLSNGLSFQV